MKLNAVAAGLAFGIFWMMGVVGVGIIHIITASFWEQGYGSEFIRIVGNVYPGYSATPAGIAIGAIWALVDGFVSIAVFAFLYNFIAARMEKK